jgi:hypothetical protein
MWQAAFVWQAFCSTTARGNDGMAQAVRSAWTFLALFVVACGSRNIDGLQIERPFEGAGGVGGWASVGGASAVGGWASVGGASAVGGWASVGGASNVGGSAGVGGAIASCIPGQSVACACTSGLSGAQICRNDGAYGACVCAGGGSLEQDQFIRIRNGMVGTWVGVQSNPWFEDCPTTLTFEANGHYSAHSPGEGCTVFYYGTNNDSPEKTYELADVLANGEGWGEIEIYFEPGNTNRGELRHVVLSADGNGLTFESWKDGYGPVVFTLERQR